MKGIDIPETCSENWNEMTPTEKGAFCQKCAMEVMDFSSMNPEQIKQTLHDKMNSRVCGRITKSQLDGLNADYELYKLNSREMIRHASFYSFLAVFGIMLFSCNSPEQVLELRNAQRAINSIFYDKTNDPDDLILGEMVAMPSDTANIDTEEPEVENELLLGKIAPYEMEEEQEVIEVREHEIMLQGAMAYTPRYMESIQEVTPIIGAPAEYDAYGNRLPVEFDSKVFPNPTSQNAKLEFAVPMDGMYVIGLYDLNGRHIRNIHEAELTRGTHDFPVVLENEPSGTYLVIIRSKEYSKTLKMMKL